MYENWLFRRVLEYRKEQKAIKPRQCSYVTDERFDMAYLDFKEPKRSRAVIGLSKALLPLHLKVTDKLAVDFVQVPPRLKQRLQGKPVIIFLNHPDRYDPLIAMKLGLFFQEDLHCIAAREVFDWDNGIRGWYFQKLGCYSVNRGARDMRSIQTTKRILSTACHKLVVFPEAEITGDPYTVHEFQRSMLHLLLCAQKEVLREKPGESILILPVATSYRLETDVESSVAKVLNAVEQKLNCALHSRKDARHRTEALISLLIDNLCREYRVTVNENDTNAQKLKEIAISLCRQVGSYLQMEKNEDFTEEQYLHCVRNKVSEHLDDCKRGNSYQRRLYREQSVLLKQFLKALDRVERLFIGHRILSQPPSPFQLCRMVDFLELEILGKMTAKGGQRASVCIGEPVEVLPFLETYKNGSKESSIDKLTALARERLQMALDVAANKTARRRQATYARR